MDPVSITAWITLIIALLGATSTLIGWVIKLQRDIRDHRAVEETLTTAAEAAESLGMAAKDVKVAVEGIQKGQVPSVELTPRQNAIMDAAVDVARAKVVLTPVVTDLIRWRVQKKGEKT